MTLNWHTACNRPGIRASFQRYGYGIKTHLSRHVISISRVLLLPARIALIASSHEEQAPVQPKGESPNTHTLCNTNTMWEATIEAGPSP
jgi:hypothetical protein